MVDTDDTLTSAVAGDTRTNDVGGAETYDGNTDDTLTSAVAGDTRTNDVGGAETYDGDTWLATKDYDYAHTTGESGLTGRDEQRYRDAGYKGAFEEDPRGGTRHDNWVDDKGRGNYDEYGRFTIKGRQEEQAYNPELSAGTEYVPAMVQEQEGEILNSADYDLDAEGRTAEQRIAATATSNLPDFVDATSYEADQVTITKEATAQGQFENLFNDMDFNNPPPWASGAIRAARENMAARGISASSISAGAVLTAAMEAGVPIAINDAAVRAKALFSNQAATNAARQFNAASEQQNQQFFSNLKSTVETFNTAQTNGMEQFNAGEATALSKFNERMADAREQFNAQNQIVVDQSNAQWRRQINQINTAAQNQANQVNAANRLEISNTAYNNMWQEHRDNLDYAFTSQENNLNRKHNIAITYLQQDHELRLLDAKEKNAFGAALGNFLGNLDGDDISGVLKTAGNLFGGASGVSGPGGGLPG